MSRPPTVSWRLAELYGLVPYILNAHGESGEPHGGDEAVQAEMLRQKLNAIQRGVRFTDWNKDGEGEVQDMLPVSDGPPCAKLTTEVR